MIKPNDKKNDIPLPREIYTDITSEIKGVNLTEKERKSIKVFIYHEMSHNVLFDGIGDLYNFIGDKFEDPKKFILIPYINRNTQNIIIQRLQ